MCVVEKRVTSDPEDEMMLPSPRQSLSLSLTSPKAAEEESRNNETTGLEGGCAMAWRARERDRKRESEPEREDREGKSKKAREGMDDEGVAGVMNK